MGFPRVKLNLYNGLALTLAVLALGSFLLSLSGWLPASLVENWYSRGVFPTISWLISPFAAASPVSLMDLILPIALALVAFLLYRRRVLAALGVLSAGYLVFFWSWGVNYHRMPVEGKLDFRPGQVTPESVAALVREAADEINQAYIERGEPGDGGLEAMAEEADARVRSVVEALDGVPADRWSHPSEVKRSWLLDPLFRAGSVSGMFNPFGHEALLAGGLLSFERPMVMLHEIAHVRGYADEGEANFVALLAAVHSTNPQLRYSGWLSFWMYLASNGNDGLLDPGPLEDLQAIYERIRRSRVEWVSRTQGRALDAFLRVNRVDEGVRSYARIVRLAAGTRHDWERFEE